MADPLPCPFCDSPDLLVLKPTCDRNSPYDPFDRACPEVRCLSCSATMHGERWDQTGDTAIDLWNLRKPTQRLREALIKAREIIKDDTPVYHHPECWPDPDEYSWIDAVLNEHPSA